MDFLINILLEAWGLLLDSSVYVIFGVVAAGLLRVFLNPGLVARHLSGGRFVSVFKAALLGIPLPLCSCGVLPAALSLKKQGANTGATAAFLISTPESGVDSIAITYALMDPLMTVARPVAALATAVAAGVAENLAGVPETTPLESPDLSCTIDGCCDGIDCPPREHAGHHGFGEKIVFGLKYAYHEVWRDMAPWFLFGLILAGLITILVPTEVMSNYLGGGLTSMLVMLAVGIPLYICATASTPIAAALILKGVSPGAALVFLLAGPATNVTSLTVMFGVLGRRATVIYLASIAVFSVMAGLLLDEVYRALGLSPVAVAGQAAEFIPAWLQWIGAVLLLTMSVGPVRASLGRRLARLSSRGHGAGQGTGVQQLSPSLSESQPGPCAGST